MKHPTSRMLFLYWDALRGERSAPERAEVEPGDIRHILTDTFLLEIGAGRRADFRLGGTRLCALFGRELKGIPLHDLWPAEARAEIGHLIDIVLDDTAGLVVGLVGEARERATVDLEMILLPLRHRGNTHARILGAMAPAAVPWWIGLDPVTRLTTTSVRVIRPSPLTAASSPLGSAAAKRRRFVLHQGGRP